MLVLNLCLLDQNAAKKIMAFMGKKSGRMDRVYPLILFKKDAAKVLGIKGDLTEADLTVVLKYLAREKGLIAYDSQVFHSHRA